MSGVDLHVVGLKKATDPKWEKYASIWKACKEAKVDIPEVVCKYFDYEDPEKLNGMQQVNLKGACTDPKIEWQDTIDVELSKLPPDIHTIRFTVTY